MTNNGQFDLLPTALNLTMIEFGAGEILKNSRQLDAIVTPTSIRNGVTLIQNPIGILCFQRRTTTQMVTALNNADLAAVSEQI
jgi:hypothetical protein